MLACVSRSVTHRIHACGAVYDFGQNAPGWCELRITGQAGLNVQLRHAELLQHPPYGPEDGSICEFTTSVMITTLSFRHRALLPSDQTSGTCARPRPPTRTS